MLYHEYNLCEYIFKTKYSFMMFDVLFKTCNETKESILEELGIAPSSYRKARSMEQKKGIEIVNILNDYFGINLMKNDVVEYYSKCLGRIITKLNYMTDDLLEVELGQLEEFIKDNNILKPIFIMFKILIKTTNEKISYKMIKEDNLLDYKYVKSFINAYTDDFKAILLILQCFFEDSNKIDFNFANAILEKAPYAKSIFYYSVTSRFFIEGKYNKAVMYAQLAEKIYEKEYNQKRLVTIKSNLAMLYNYLEEYSLSCVICEEFGPSIYAYSRNTAVFINFKIQYYQALLMTKQIDKLNHIISTMEILDHIDYLFLGIIFVINSEHEKIAKIITEYQIKKLSINLEAFKILQYFYDKYIQNIEVDNIVFIKEIKNQTMQKIILALLNKNNAN